MISVDVTDELTPALTELIGQIEKPTPVWNEFGGYLQRRWRNSMRNAPSHSLDSAPAGQPPWRHKGGFARSIVWVVIGGGLFVGSTFIGAQMLHEGGEIRMKDKYLTIPVHWEAYGKRARDMVLHFIPSTTYSAPGSRGTLVEDATGRVMFVLMAHVTIKPHPWATFLAKDERELDQIVTRHLTDLPDLSVD